MDNELSKIIGQRINKLLVINNVKQKDLAEYLGVPDNTISYFCNGKRMPNTEQIKKISDFFNVSSDYLLGISPVRTKDKDVQFICDYVHLNETSINLLHKWYSSSNTEILNFFLNGLQAFDFVDFSHKFVVYKAQYKKLVEYKEQMLKNNSRCFNADDIEKILDEDKKLNDDILLTEFKIQKSAINLLNLYTKEERQLDEQHKEEYNYLIADLYNDYIRLTEIPD